MMDNEKQFAIKLADNEKKTRDRALAKIRRYIEARASTDEEPFVEEDFIKLWKGMHYSMWMCDKPLIQEELADRICNLVSCFNNKDDQVVLFIRTYFQTILREWNGIDKWRIDKFMMQMRRMLNKMLEFLSSRKWKKTLIKTFNQILVDYPLNINNDSYPDGVAYHVTDIFLEELGKHGESLKPIRACMMLQPFYTQMAISKKKPFVLHIAKRVFGQIIECSDVGLEPEMEEEMKELKAFGLQLGEAEDDSEYVVKFKYRKIALQLKKVVNTPGCLARNKKTINDLVVKFTKLAKGIYPIEDFDLPDLEKDTIEKRELAKTRELMKIKDAQKAAK